jgi:hypothetical protein
LPVFFGTRPSGSFVREKSRLRLYSASAVPAAGTVVPRPVEVRAAAFPAAADFFVVVDFFVAAGFLGALDLFVADFRALEARAPVFFRADVVGRFRAVGFFAGLMLTLRVRDSQMAKSVPAAAGTLVHSSHRAQFQLRRVAAPVQAE